MPILGFQDLWIAGSRLYFKRDAVDGVDQPIIDFGVIEPVTPSYNVNQVKLYDSDGGVKRLLDMAVTQIDESYQCKTNNMNLDNLSLAFLARPPQDFTQAATPVTLGTTVHRAHLGRLIKVQDNDGHYIWGLTTVDKIVMNGTLTLTLDDDYVVANLERGLIRIVEESTNVIEGSSLTIGYTPRAITGSRLLNPQTMQGNTRGKCFLVYGRGNNQFQSVREADVIISPSNWSVSADNYSDIELKLDVLNDPTLEIPAGRFLQWIGELPAKS